MRRGTHHTAETRAKMSAAKMGHPVSPETRAKTSSERKAVTWAPVRVLDGIAVLDEAALLAPLRWRKPRHVTVSPDLFDETLTDVQIDRVCAVMALCPQHTFEVPTACAERMREYVSSAQRETLVGAAMSAIITGTRKLWPGLIWPLPNVWLGVVASDQATADERIPELLATPAAVRFLSLEPLLGAVDLGRWVARKPFYMAVCEHCGYIGSSETFHLLRHYDDADVVCPQCENTTVADEAPGLDWVRVGGESGPCARPSHPDWFRNIRDQCAAAGVAFFFKQWGEWAPAQAVHLHSKNGQWCRDVWMLRVGKRRSGRRLDGVLHDAMPGRA